MDKMVTGSCVGYVQPPDLDQRIKNKICEDILLTLTAFCFLEQVQLKLLKNLILGIPCMPLLTSAC